MTNRTTQRRFIEDRLLSNGRVSRNDCLANFISRLGAYICDLKRDGWEFVIEEPTTTRPDGSLGRDYVYVATKKPEIIVY